MKKIFLSTLFLLSSFAYSQISFEKGYYITNTGEKKEVFIKNFEWKNNPNTIFYKTPENENPIEIKTSELKEFSVSDQKYVSATVMIDRSVSSNNIRNLSTSPEINSTEENLLLKLLVEGKINLYKYFDGSTGSRFFYKKENEEVFKPLHYKEYLVNDNLIQKNEEYKTVLKKEFADNENITSKNIERLSYQENHLVKIFNAYNYITEDKTKNKGDFHVYVKPGLGFSHNEILSDYPKHQISPNESYRTIQGTKKNAISYRIATEFEYVFNFNKGKWSIFFDPSFQTVKIVASSYAEWHNSNTGINNKVDFQISFKHSSLQIPIGIKYSMFINKKTKLYVGAALASDIALNKNTFTTNDATFKSSFDGIFPYFRLGFSYDKFGVELNTNNVPYAVTDFSQNGAQIGMGGMSLYLNYKLF